MKRTSTLRWVLGLASAASFMAALDTLVVSTSLSTIQRDLGATLEQLEWTINSYNLSFAVLLMTAAVVGDRFGRRLMFATGLGTFSLASAACAVAPSVGWLIAARAVQGAGAALIMTLSLALVSAAFPPERRGSALGVYMMLTGLAVASGPVIGGAISEGLAWEWIFWVNVPLGLLAVPLVLTRIEEIRGPDRRLDLPGVVLITAGALGVTWGLVRGNASGWDSVEVLAAGIGGLSALAGFVYWERRAPAPMLPLRFFRARGFSAANAASFFRTACLYGAVFFFAQYLQIGLGDGPLEAGLHLLPWTATLFVVAPLAGAAVDRYGERPLLVGGLLLTGTGMAWVALIAEPNLAYGSLIAPFVVAGVGVSMTFPAGQNAAMGSVPPEAIGKASGTLSTMNELGGVFGIALLVAVFAGAGSYASPDAFVEGFAPGIAVGAALALVGALAAAFVPPRGPETRAEKIPIASPGSQPELDREAWDGV